MPDSARRSIRQRDETASERAQRLVLMAVTLFRIGGIVQVLLVVALVFTSYRHPALVALVVAGIMAENGILLTLCWRRRVLAQSWVFADVAVTAVALLTGAMLTSSADYNTWANFAYPYSIIAQVNVGLGIRRLSVVMALNVAMASLYLALTVSIHHDPAWNTLANSLGYFTNSIVTWLVARELRVGGRRLDDSRQAAEEQAGLLARERERTRSARMLHDRVLQTLEMLAGTDWIGDKQVRRRVAVEAAWLRSFVKDGAGNQSPHLLEALIEMIERHISAGLRVLVNDAQLRASGGDDLLSPDGMSALIGAVDELLTNVAKHAEAGEVTVRIAPSGGGVQASVVDGGRGFDPDQPTNGTGLRHSVRGRIEEAGGVVRLDSAPGQGTSIEVWVPRAR
ncbi:MAG: ATP-binding protein [Actinomycetota bacterium]|nr:ATP-binding protein [Actinomycetota bacterium]